MERIWVLLWPMSRPMHFLARSIWQALPLRVLFTAFRYRAYFDPEGSGITTVADLRVSALPWASGLTRRRRNQCAHCLGVQLDDIAPRCLSFAATSRIKDGTVMLDLSLGFGYCRSNELAVTGLAFTESQCR